MAKKKVNKTKSKNILKVPKIKSQPIHFKDFNLNKKIISVVLIVLAIGVIGSVFPGESSITGGAIGDLIIDSFKTIDTVITTIMPTGLSAEKILVYEKFVLFLLLFALLSMLAKLAKLTGITNFVVAGAISLISTWFIPETVLVMIGVTYSTVYASLLILVPVVVVGLIAWQMPKTKHGYWWKAFIYALLLIIFAATKEGLVTKYGTGAEAVAAFGAGTKSLGWYTTFGDSIMLVLIILVGYCIYRALTMSNTESIENYNTWRDEQSAGIAMQLVDQKMVNMLNDALKVGQTRAGAGKDIGTGKTQEKTKTKGGAIGKAM